MLITEKAPAKLNLSLDSPMRYLDGMPKWDMVMVSVDLADRETLKYIRIVVFFPTTNEILHFRLPIFCVIGSTIGKH